MIRSILFLAVLAVVGCESRPSPPLPPREIDPVRASLKELQQGTAHAAVASGAKAGQQLIIATNPPEPVAPPAPPKPVTMVHNVKVFETNIKAPVVAKVEATVSREPAKVQPLIKLSDIRSDKPQATREKAVTDALQVAQYRIMEQLLMLDPPVQAKPSLAMIRHEFLKGNSVREIAPTDEMKEKWKAEKLDPNRMWVTLDVELTEAQVQTLRAGDRVTDGIRGAGVLFALFAAVFGFLRLDAFTKGYLTWWLAIAAVVFVVAVALGTTYFLAW